MTLFDLVFLLLCLASFATLGVVGILTLRRRSPARLCRGLIVTWLAYTVVLVGVALLSPRRVVATGTPQCADDWCLTLVAVEATATPTGTEYVLELDLTNRGRGRPQRERFVSVYLVDADGRRVDPLADPDAVPFDTLVTVGHPVRARRRFRLPAAHKPMAMVVAREGPGRFPGCCIIADDNSLGHKPTFIQLGLH